MLIDDANVRRQLRELHQPMSHFGETQNDRKNRLKEFIAKNPESVQILKEIYANSKNDNKKENQKKDTFYTEASDNLKQARYNIAAMSIQKSDIRLNIQRNALLNSKADRLAPQLALIDKIREMQDEGCYLDDDPKSTGLQSITSCNLNTSATILATSFANGKCKLWSMPHMETKADLYGHECLAKYITFHPKSGDQDDSVSKSCVNLASCAIDGSIILWSLDKDSPLHKLSDTQPWKVTRLRFFPNGSYLATCCSDSTWRLWDMESQTELLKQGGHSDAVHDINFHPDGSLAASASLDSTCRIWDLRTGRSIFSPQGHTAGVTSIDFSPNGFHFATGGMDNSVKVWNLRERKLEYTIPAHRNCVTKVQFEKENGFYLASSSFDTTVKFWSTQTWAPVKTLEGYDNKVTDFDISKASNLLVTCYLKFVKLWSADV